MHRRLTLYIHKGQYPFLVVHYLRLYLPVYYLTEYAIVLAHRLLPTLLARPTRAQARATATIPAVSLRSRYGPSDAIERPVSPAFLNSPSLQPPSGPTNRLTVEPDTA